MQSEEGWFNRFVNGLPNTRLFNLVAKWVLVPLWARWTHYFFLIKGRDFGH